MIEKLKKSDLIAEHAGCGEFKLSEALLFDGTKPFPKEAMEAQNKKKEELNEMEDDFKKRKKLIMKKAEITTKAVNIGKRFEKILPTVEDFKWARPDVRFLADPIDFIVFNGLSQGDIKSIDFVEVKCGEARLNKHQKLVKEAVEDSKVSYKAIK